MICLMMFLSQVPTIFGFSFKASPSFFVHRGHRYQYQYQYQQQFQKQTQTSRLLSSSMSKSEETDTDGSSSTGTSTSTSTSTEQITTSQSMTDRIIQAAADMTTSSSSVLGIKSIGVDYGLVRTGIAVSNGYNPLPLSILSHQNNTQLNNKIIRYVEIENANQIVMGLPFHKNGTEANQTIITRNFASQLNCAVCAHFGYDKIPIYLWDERYTSKEAEARIRAVNPRAGLLYKDLDADSASIILEYYYGDNGLGAELVTLPDNDEIKEVVHQAWLMRKEEQRKEMQLLKEQRMNAGNAKQQLIEKARLLDEKLAKERGENSTGGGKKKGKKKKKKKKKRTYVNLTSSNDNTNSVANE